MLLELTTIRTIYAIAAIVIALLLFRSYNEKRDNIILKNFVIFFLFFAFYRFFLIPPVIIESLKIASASYNLAVVMFFAMVILGIKIVSSLLEISTKKIKQMEYLALLIGLGVVGYQLLSDVTNMEIFSSGIIMWNSNPIPLYMTGVSGFIVASIWVYTFFTNFTKTKEKILKIKSSLMMLSTFFVGLSSIFHFLPSEKAIAPAFIFSLLGIIGILSALVFHSKKKQV